MSVGFLLIASLLVFAACGALLAPLFRASRADASNTDEAAVNELARRLAAVEIERDAGLLEADAAEEAVLEAKRAVLAASKTAAPAPSSSAAARVWRFVAVAAVGLVPIAAAALYLTIGAPGMEQFAHPPPQTTQNAPSSAEAIQALDPQARSAAIEAMVDGLAARLAETPEDPAGWRMLARSQGVLGRHEDAAESYRQLLALTPAAAEDWRNFAAARLAAASEDDFPTDDEFRSILAEIETRAPGDPVAQFYRGGLLKASGDLAGAASVWRALKARLPADAPILGVLDGLIAAAEAEAAAQSGAPEAEIDAEAP